MCTFAHGPEELKRYTGSSLTGPSPSLPLSPSPLALPPSEPALLASMPVGLNKARMGIPGMEGEDWGNHKGLRLVQTITPKP